MIIFWGFLMCSCFCWVIIRFSLCILFCLWCCINLWGIGNGGWGRLWSGGSILGRKLNWVWGGWGIYFRIFGLWWRGCWWWGDGWGCWRSWLGGLLLRGGWWWWWRSRRCGRRRRWWRVRRWIWRMRRLCLWGGGGIKWGRGSC